MPFVLGGLVAAEGSFIVTTRGLSFVSDGSPRLRFVFQLTMATRDRELLESLHRLLGAGSVNDRPARDSRWLPYSVYTLNSMKMHKARTIPFAESCVLASAKRRQFEQWRDALYRYEVERPTQYGRAPSIGSEPGCGQPVRARALCRSDYYRATGY
jgi:hypothetical protein